MTLAEAIIRVRSIFRESSTGLLTDTEITQWLNDGNDMFHSNSGVTDRWEIDVLTDDWEIGFTTDILRVQKLTFIEDGETEETKIDDEDFEFYDNTLFMNDAFTSDGTIVCYGERLPTQVTTGGTFEIPREYEEALISYALFRARQKDESPLAIQDFQLFASMRTEYERKPLKINTRKWITIKRRI
jgi:hypothetical protein